MSRVYNELARHWYRLFTPVWEYREEAEFFHEVIVHRSKIKTETILELGSGAGHNAFHLKQWYTLTLTDISEPMLSLSRDLNPECMHLIGNMKSIRLNKTFDAVFIHDAIMYITTTDELRQVFNTAHQHCRKDGLLLISPDFVKESFQPGTDGGGSDNGSRGVRYLEWKTDPDPKDDVFTVDYACLLRENGKVWVEHDQHIEGLFSQSTWLALLQEAGFDAQPLPDAFGRVNFLGYKR